MSERCNWLCKGLASMLCKSGKLVVFKISVIKNGVIADDGRSFGTGAGFILTGSHPGKSFGLKGSACSLKIIPVFLGAAAASAFNWSNRDCGRFGVNALETTEIAAGGTAVPVGELLAFNSARNWAIVSLAPSSGFPQLETGLV